MSVWNLHTPKPRSGDVTSTIVLSYSVFLTKQGQVYFKYKCDMSTDNSYVIVTHIFWVI